MDCDKRYSCRERTKSCGVVVALVCASLFVCGCAKEGEATSNDLSPVQVDGLNQPQLIDDGPDWLAVTDDGRSVAIQSLEPIEFTPHNERERVYEESSRAFHLNPETGQVATRLYCCLNPDCSGRRGSEPYVFAPAPDGLPLTRGGSIDFVAIDRDSPRYLKLFKCPICNSPRNPHPYDPPEVAERRKVLEEQLLAARDVRRRFKRKGQAPPTGIRSPNDIMADIDALPKLFLLPK